MVRRASLNVVKDLLLHDNEMPSLIQNVTLFQNVMFCYVYKWWSIHCVQQSHGFYRSYIQVVNIEVFRVRTDKISARSCRISHQKTEGLVRDGAICHIDLD